MSYKCLSILQGVVLEDGDKCTLLSQFYHLPAIPLGGGQTWEVKPNTFYRKAWLYMMATEQGWFEMCAVRRPKTGRAASEGCSQKSGACWH